LIYKKKITSSIYILTRQMTKLNQHERKMRCTSHWHYPIVQVCQILNY
jgi:hypothetical protein